MKLLFGLPLLACPAMAHADVEQLATMVLGEYILVGKELDSDDTYLGKLAIESKNDRLVVTRNISGNTVEGTATVETANGGDAEVLRIRFSEKGADYEQTCLARGDLDNYARISCYLYKPGVETRNPGLEVLFHDHASK